MMSDANKKQDDEDISYLFPSAPKPGVKASAPAVSSDDVSYLFPNSKSQADVNRKIYEDAMREQNDLYGATAGGVLGAGGYLVREATNKLENFAEQKAKDILGNIANNPEDQGLSPGQKWHKKVVGDKNYTPPGSGTSSMEAAQNLEKQRSSGEITKRIEKKFGKLGSGRLSIQGAPVAEVAPKPTWIETPGGRLISTVARSIPKITGDIIHGAAHGLNIADQAQQAFSADDPISAALHGTSGVGSFMSALSSVWPTAEASAGLKQLGGPLAMYGLGAADIYDELKNKEYGKAAITAAAVPMLKSGWTAPIGATALYFREHPEEFEKAVNTPEPKKPFRYRGFGLD